MTEVEHSQRSRDVTEQVALWVQNDYEPYTAARRLLDQGVTPGQLGHYLSTVLRYARKGSAAWHVAQELAPNDYRRIHWDDIAAELRGGE